MAIYAHGEGSTTCSAYCDVDLFCSQLHQWRTLNMN
jgi:hypothetical protein